MSKKTIVIILAVVVSGLLIFTLVNPKGWGEAVLNQFASAPAEQEVDAGDESSFIEMPTIAISVIGQDGKMKMQVHLTLQLDVAKQDVAAVKTQLPVIRNAFYADLHDYLPKHMHTRETPDLYVVKQHLQGLAATLVHGKIKDIVIKGAFNR